MFADAPDGAPRTPLLHLITSRLAPPDNPSRPFHRAIARAEPAKRGGKDVAIFGVDDRGVGKSAGDWLVMAVGGCSQRGACADSVDPPASVGSAQTRRGQCRWSFRAEYVAHCGGAVDGGGDGVSVDEGHSGSVVAEDVGDAFERHSGPRLWPRKP